MHVNTRGELERIVEYIEGRRVYHQDNAVFNNTCIAIKLKVAHLMSFIEMDERNCESRNK